MRGRGVALVERSNNQLEGAQRLGGMNDLPCTGTVLDTLVWLHENRAIEQTIMMFGICGLGQKPPRIEYIIHPSRLALRRILIS